MMVSGPNDGDSTTDSASDFDFKSFTPKSVFDYVVVNRLRKDTRNSKEPVTKDNMMELLRRASKKVFKNKEQIKVKHDESENSVLETVEN
jgi:hypothetical protein